VGGFDLGDDFLEATIGSADSKTNGVDQHGSGGDELIDLHLAALGTGSLARLLPIFDEMELLESVVTRPAAVVIIRHGVVPYLSALIMRIMVQNLEKRAFVIRRSQPIGA
jgi:hypothetical protein